MTNGEKLKSDFPYIEIKGQDEVFTTIQIDTTGTGTPIIVYTEWWNAEYNELTTKNDCAEQNGCISCSLDDGDDCCRKLYEESMQEQSTKNNLPHCQHTDEEIAKSFIEDVEAVKDQLPCGEQMDFPNTFDEFAKDYGFRDKKEIYTNGSELIPVFRVKQWLEHISTTKNNLGVDAVSRKAVINQIFYSTDNNGDVVLGSALRERIARLPSVTPQAPRGIYAKWEQLDNEPDTFFTMHQYKCSNCGKIQLAKSKNIKKFRYCSNCGADMREVEE